MTRVVVLHEVGRDDYLSAVKDFHSARVDSGDTQEAGISIRAFSDKGDSHNPHNDGLYQAIEEAEGVLISEECSYTPTGLVVAKVAQSAGVFVCEYTTREDV